MRKRCSCIIVLVCFSSIAVFGAIVDQGVAAQKKVSKQAPPAISVKPLSASPKPARANAQSRPSTSIAPTAREKRAKSVGSEDKETPASSKTSPHKSSRKAKGKKKARLKAVGQSRTDLMYHGMLEDPGRYDPRPNYRTAGVPKAAYLRAALDPLV